MERIFSDKKTVKVVLSKLLVSCCLYGPITNGAFLAAVPILSTGAFTAFNRQVFLKQLAHVTTRDVQVRKHPPTHPSTHPPTLPE